MRSDWVRTTVCRVDSTVDVIQSKEVERLQRVRQRVDERRRRDLAGVEQGHRLCEVVLAVSDVARRHGDHSEPLKSHAR